MCVCVRCDACTCVRACACVHSAVAMLKMDIVVKCFFDFVSTVDTTKNKVAQSDGDAGADVDADSSEGSGCHCGCEPCHQCWPHFLDPTHPAHPPPPCPFASQPTVLLSPSYAHVGAAIGRATRPVVGGERGGGCVVWLLLLGVGQCFLFRLPYAYFNFCFSLRAHAPRAPNFHVTPFP